MSALLHKWEGSPRARIISIALIAALLSLGFFSPRFAYWRLLGVDVPLTTSEVIRGNAAMVQLADPSAEFESDANRVLHWRVFFPLLGHILNLPVTAYLAIPHAGALLVLLFVGYLLTKHAVDGWTSLAAVALMATTSWYFVSIGWLGYFDSWLVLGQLVMVFAPGWRWLVACTLVTPWIDERYVIMIPIGLLLRQKYRAAFCPAEEVENLRMTLVRTGAAALPWFLIRFAGYFDGHDATTTAYAQGLVARQSALSTGNYLLGIWQGIRFCWVPVMAWLAFEQRGRPARAIVLFALFFVTMLVNVFIATDVSRSMSTLMPAVLLGVLLLWKHRPAFAAVTVRSAAVLNLVLPAMHVTGGASLTIHSLPTEIAEYRNPPVPLTPDYYLRQALAHEAAKRYEEGVQSATIAVQLAPEHRDARATRAVLLFRLSRFSEALPDAIAAVRIDPNNQFYRNNLACIRAELGDLRGAIADWDRLLRDGVPDSALRAQIVADREEMLGRMQAAKK